MEISEKKEGSLYSVTFLDENKEIGHIEAISDGHEWSRITELKVAPEYEGEQLEVKLIESIKKTLKVHHIFAVTEQKLFPVYEEAGFFRSKTSFTFTETVNGETLKDWEDAGLFLPEGFRFEEEFYPRKSFIDNGSIEKKKDVGEIRYSDTLDGADFNEINRVLSKAFGGHERDANKTREVFSTSEKVELAFDGSTLVGVARAVTDNKSNALILNVAVDPCYQGFHIGWNIVVKLAEQLPDYSVFLNTHPGAVGFYNRKGFRRNRTAFCYIEGNMPLEISKGFNLPEGYRFPDEY